MKNERALPAIIDSLYRPILRFQAISSLNHLRLRSNDRSDVSRIAGDTLASPIAVHRYSTYGICIELLAGHRLACPEEIMQKRKQEINGERHGEGWHLHYGRGNLPISCMVLADALNPARPCNSLSKPYVFA
jgi:hypothetical protein